MTDVLRKAVQVTGVTRQLEVNARHTRAKGDNTAGSCQRGNYSRCILKHSVLKKQPLDGDKVEKLRYFLLSLSHTHKHTLCLLPPMRKSSPATYCMRSCCWQQPRTPMIQPKEMIETAMPTNPAVILRRSAAQNTNVKPCVSPFMASVMTSIAC